VWTNGTYGKQYFVVEHRRKTKFDFYIPNKGLLIYHVDENMTSNTNERCGAGSPHYRVALEQADGDCDLENNVNQGDNGDPYPGSGGTHNPNTSFNLISTPNSNSYTDAATGVSVYNIHFSGGDGYASFAVSPVPPTVTVASPNGGEVLQVGDPDTIRWVAFDDIAVDSVSILLSTDGGATFPTVLAHGEANDSSYVWTVAGPPSTNCRIRVLAYDRSGYSAYDASNADFQIYDPAAGVVDRGTADFRIVSVKPNPTASGTQIAFSSPRAGAEADIYDVGGRLVRSLAVRTGAAGGGAFEASWDGTDSRGSAMSPGIYFLRVTSGARAQTARITIVR
ncbi:MAG TPA: T9SS type A sorting domain-containing protein, partial [bacterium]|nr:T9SS type A sorting domain-containing protein [bacterium]